MEKVIGIIVLIIGISGAVFLYKWLPSLFAIPEPGTMRSEFISPPVLPTSPITQRGQVTIHAGATSGSRSGVGVSVSSGPTISKPAVAPSLYQSVKISGLSSYSYATPPYAELTLSAQTDAPLDVSGWKVKSQKDYFTIPQAYKVYSGNAANDALSDIEIKKGDRVIIYTHSGAVIPGFRLNKCMGYLTRAVKFSPSFYATCPAIDLKTTTDFSSQCQDYVRRLGSCETPGASLPLRPDDFACLNFLSKLNYASCLSDHRGESDFFGTEWRVWLGDSFGNARNIFDPLHDKIRLYTKDGTLVDEYTY